MKDTARIGAEEGANSREIQKMQELAELVPFFVEYCARMEKAADDVARV